jgi:hypothetical protein
MKQTISTICDFCKKEFLFVGTRKYYNRYKHHFCSKFCNGQYQIRSQKVLCKNCGKEFVKLLSNIKTSPNHFCSKSCAVTYNNTHKTNGYRRSKIEFWLESKLTELYPDEEILFNDKTAINSELDIYFPRLKLAFELNGIFHYEPIYGKERLKQTQTNDQRKFLLCQQKGISLCIIDVSELKYFKEEKLKKYLNIITKIIQPLMVPPHRLRVQSPSP